VRSNALANVFEPTKIAGSVFQATRRHHGWNNRVYRSSAGFSDRASPESSSASPSRNLVNLPLVELDVSGDRFCREKRLERSVLRDNASRLALNPALILVVTTVVPVCMLRS
jgi:hypothetical protein